MATHTSARRQVLWRTLAGGFLVAGMIAAPVYGQSSGRVGTVVAESAPVMLLPDPSRVPLAQLAAGTAVRIIGTEGEWLNIEFRDGRFGLRVGYVLKAHVKMVEPAAPSEAAQRLAAAQAAARKLAETDSSKLDGGPTSSTSCRRIDCIPARDLMNTRPPLLVNPRISETVKRQ